MSQPNVWIIDHRDSFTWNLAELVRRTGMAVPRVVSNESPELEQAVQAGEKLILSPPVRERWRMPATGPPSVFWTACPALPPVLGVCLGHQILGVRFGARLEHLSRPLHGARGIHTQDGAVSPFWKDCRNNFLQRFTIPGALPLFPGRLS